ncbi:hypothetical protein B0J17DRAFT_681926 [Rhizoctonia solani]|nr:hypothetical protein B0J17DRAFT_681926 [Rhizoctonia solani]
MTIPSDQFHLPPTIDRNALASAVALASNALAAAAEALAEASKAMSDASQVDVRDAPSGVHSGSLSHTRSPYMVESEGKPMRSEVNQAHDPGIFNGQNEPQIDEAIDAEPDDDPSTPAYAIYPDWNMGNNADKIPVTMPASQDRISMLLSLDYEHVKPDSGSETSTEANNQSWYGQADQDGMQTSISLTLYIKMRASMTHTNQQDSAQYEQGIFFTLPRPPPTQSSGEVEPIPLPESNNPELSTQLPQFHMRDNRFVAPGTLKSELNNKRLRKDPPTSLDEQGFTVDSHSGLLEPPTTKEFPPGRNYVRLAQPSDAISFIAFIAKQPGRILCVTPDEATARTSSSDVEDLKTVSVYRVYTTKLIEATRRKLQSCPDAQPPIGVFMSANILVPHQTRTSARTAYCTGDHPPTLRNANITQTLSLSPPPRMLCVMVIGNRPFDESAYGILPYPDSVLNAFSKFSVELRSRQLRQIPLKPVSKNLSIRPKANTTPGSSNLPQSGPPMGVASSSWVPGLQLATSPIMRRNQQSLPKGHYYIVLAPDQYLPGAMLDRDIIPLVAFIALNSTRVICQIPGDKDLATYQRLINSIANVYAIIPTSTKSQGIKVASEQLENMQNGLLFRSLSTGGQWKSRWRKSHADCLIYCGMPSDLKDYFKECQTKVAHSYMVLTQSQFAALRWQLAAIPLLQQHPFIPTSAGYSPGTLLYELREKLGAFIS